MMPTLHECLEALWEHVEWCLGFLTVWGTFFLLAYLVIHTVVEWKVQL